MAVSYDRLWKLLIDRKMNKTQLCEKAKISTNAMAKLGRCACGGSDQNMSGIGLFHG